ncbi:MAG: DUF5671 domain-containing protein [Parcubacteria group bacterium]
MTQPQTQGERTPHTSAADVFSHLLMFLMLYIAAFAFLSLLFDYVDQIYPPKLPTFFGQAANTIIIAMATLVVVWPVYVVMAWLTGKWMAKDRTRRHLGIRRWLVYLTLFVAAVTLIIDLITLVYNFLSGGLTASFALKVGAVLIVAGAIFGYYLWDMRRSAAKTLLPRVLSIVTSVVLAGTIVAGFFIAGSPTEQRDRRYDERRVIDLQSIQNEIINFYGAKKELPANIGELANDITGFVVPNDPESGAPYGYEATNGLTFRLCATFVLEQAYSDGSYPMMESYGPFVLSTNWDHPAGRHCYDREIDPERLQILYPGSSVIKVPPTAAEQATKSFTEERYGSVFDYPQDWSAEMAEVDEVSRQSFCPDEPNIISFQSEDTSVVLSVGVRKKGDAVTLQCRTGVGAGEFQAGENVTMAGSEVPVSLLVFEGKAVEAFIGSEEETFIVELDGYELVATISCEKTTQGSGKDIRDQAEFSQALTILESLLLPGTGRV